MIEIIRVRRLIGKVKYMTLKLLKIVFFMNILPDQLL